MPVRLLAVDTTEDACSAALLLGDELVERFEVAPRRHGELLLPMMDGLLADAGLGLRELDALACARGPGSFTGVRIAVSVVQGAAFAAGLPVVPVSSLQALAQGGARMLAADAVLAALDARMQEVYWGAYRTDATGILRAAIDDCVAPPERVPMPDGDDWIGAGSGWAAHAAALTRRCGRPCPHDGGARVHAADVARIAAVLFAEGAAVAAEQALPCYLRDQVAQAPR